MSPSDSESTEWTEIDCRIVIVLQFNSERHCLLSRSYRSVDTRTERQSERETLRQFTPLRKVLLRHLAK